MITLLLLATLGTSTAVTVAPGETLNVVAAGDGPLVVLMPGLAGCAYGYRHVVHDLVARGYGTVIIEPLGFGSSAKPPGVDYSLTAQADRVAAVLDSLGAGSVLIVGHGVTVSVALRLAVRRPDLVRGIIAIEGGAAESAATPAVEKSLKFASLVAKLGGGRVLRERFAADLKAASGDPAWVKGLVVRKYFAPVARDLRASIAALRAMARASEPQALSANLDRVRCPVLVLTGAAPHAGALPEAALDQLVGNLAGVTHRSIAGAGHYVFEENPRAVVDAVVSLDTAGSAATGTVLVGRAGNDSGRERGGASCAR